MKLHTMGRYLAATLALLLAGCASLGEPQRQDFAREEAVYFENKDGKLEKVAVTFSQTADRRNVIFLRSMDAKHYVVCAEQPTDLAVTRAAGDAGAPIHRPDAMHDPDGRRSAEARPPMGRPHADDRAHMGRPPLRDAQLDLLRVAFFQNCIARANGFIDDQSFERAHRALIEAVSGRIGGPPGGVGRPFQR